MSINKYIFDDGSLESKVLQHDIPDAQVFKVKPYAKLDTWLAEILEEDDNIKFVYLHFCQGDLIKQDKDIRTEIATALHNYPYLRIILRYEQMDKPSIERRAGNLGISQFDYVADNLGVSMNTDIENRMEKAVEQLEKETKVKLNELDKILEDNKDKIKLIEYNKEKAQDYGKYSVGGESTPVPAKESVSDEIIKELRPDDDPITKRINAFKDKRRRKKKE